MKGILTIKWKMAAQLILTGMLVSIGVPWCAADYNGDGEVDLAVYDQTTGKWNIRSLSGDVILTNAMWGGTGWTAVPGDFDGDRRDDLAAYKESIGKWNILSVSGSAILTDYSFGETGKTPVQGDFDGDGRSDLALYNESSGDWDIRTVAGSAILSFSGFGGAGYSAVPGGDFDGDGKTDPAIYRAADGVWSVGLSGNNYVVFTLGGFGAVGAIPLAADSDGDGKADPTVYEESSGNWFVKLSANGYATVTFCFGGPGYIAFAADFDGDGKADPTVYEESTGTWKFWFSSEDYTCTTRYLGGPNNVPVENLHAGSPLAPPGSISADCRTNEIYLSWASCQAATGYEVWRHTSSNNVSASRIGMTANTWFADTDVSYDYLYHYWVKATNSYTFSCFSAYTTGYKKIMPPTGVSASDGTYTDKVRVTWTAGIGATAYEVWRGTTNVSASAAKIGDATGTTYNDTGATADVLYYYWVKGKIATQTSAFSDPDSGYAAVTSYTGSADLSAGSVLFTPVIFSAGAHPELVMLLLVNNGPNRMAGTPVLFDFYLSRNTVFGDADDLWMGDYSADVTLDVNGYTTVIVSDAGLSKITIPSDADGNYYVFARARHGGTLSDPDDSNNVVMRSGAVIVGSGSLLKTPVAGDFDGDGKTDLALYQEATGTWQVKLSGSGYGLVEISGYGAVGCAPLAGDFDGDGQDDPAVYQESTGSWYVWLSASEYAPATVNLGGIGYSPAKGDFNGGGRSDLAVYRAATGYWLMIMAETTALSYSQFGMDGYAPVTGDYDGDRKTDLALYKAATGTWYVKLSGSGNAVSLTGFGGTGYQPVSGDYDGDGKQDLMLYQESTGTWMVRLSGSDYAIASLEGYGGLGWTPVVGDYDGDSQADLVVYEAATSTWTFRLSASGYVPIPVVF